MPGARLPMRKIRDVLRLRAGGMSKRKIAASLSIGVTAAGDCVRRARRAGLGLAPPGGPHDAAPGNSLYPPPPLAAEGRGPPPGRVGIYSRRPPPGRGP